MASLSACQGASPSLPLVYPPLLLCLVRLPVLTTFSRRSALLQPAPSCRAPSGPPCAAPPAPPPAARPPLEQLAAPPWWSGECRCLGLML